MESSVTTDNNDNGFKLWKDWFVVTMKKPLKRFNFWVYFIVGICICGGAGVWLTFLPQNKPDELLMAICSFFPAIAGASCMDFIFGEDERKYIRGFSILCATILSLFTFISFYFHSYSVAILATFISLVLWWLANAENSKLTDIAKPLSPLGGDVHNDVKGTAGDISI